MVYAGKELRLQDGNGNLMTGGATVEVRNENGGALATLYSDRNGASLANPFTDSDNDGKVRFYVAGGRYRIDVTLGAFSDTLRDVPIGLQQERDVSDVESVNGQIGAVDINSDDIDDASGAHSPAGSVADALAGIRSDMREGLEGNRTYYVRTDGSDANNGLANTAGGAFLTIQKAWDTIADTLDLRGYTVTVQIADGTYTAGVSTAKGVVGQNGPRGVTFQGNSGTPANVLVSVTSGYCFCAVLANLQDTSRGAQFLVKDMELRTTTSGDCILAMGGASAILFSNIRFGACAGNHIRAAHGAWVTPDGNYAVTGSAVAHAQAETGACIALHNWTITYSNSPAFSQANIRALYLASVFVNNMTFTNGGTVTGSRYTVAANGVIETGGGGANYIPGNSAGAAVSGGQYI